MKKITLLLAILFTSIASFSQWTFKTVNNGLDEPYKIAYSKSDNSTVLKLEKTSNGIAFYIQGGYHCEEYPSVDLSFNVAGEYKRYSLSAYTSSDREAVFLIDDLLSSEILEDFKKSSELTIRINETYCHSDLYKFSMSKSESALNFISK